MDRTAAETRTCATHNFHKSQTSMPPAGFEHTIPASEWPHTYLFGRVANGIGRVYAWGYTKFYFHVTVHRDEAL
jgi:hypothetical protein